MAKTRPPYRLYGWPASPYTAKVRAYVRFKELPVVERRPSMPELTLRIKRAVGKAVMPTVLTPSKRWLQDSSDIIDAFERRFPEPSITPQGPRQRLTSLLLELHGDEWLPIPALHYRWNTPENEAFAFAEFGRDGLPWFPAVIQRRVGRRVGGAMSRYLPMVGVTDATIPGVERFATSLIAQLETHLADQPFLLGSRPCLGDFALYGPLWAHLFRDPATTRLFDDAPSVRQWMARLERRPASPGAFHEDDHVPETLEPILRTLFEEQLIYMRALVAAIDAWCAEHPDATRVPRALGDTDEFSIGGVAGRRRLVTFGQWMLQRPASALAAMSAEDRAVVDPWLVGLGGEGFRALEIRHPFERRDFKMWLR